MKTIRTKNPRVYTLDDFTSMASRREIVGGDIRFRTNTNELIRAEDIVKPYREINRGKRCYVLKICYMHGSPCEHWISHNTPGELTQTYQQILRILNGEE